VRQQDVQFLLVFTFALSEHPQALVQHTAGFYTLYFKQVPETVSFGYQRHITSKKTCCSLHAEIQLMNLKHYILFLFQ